MLKYWSSTGNTSQPVTSGVARTAPTHLDRMHNDLNVARCVEGERRGRPNQTGPLRAR